MDLASVATSELILGRGRIIAPPGTSATPANMADLSKTAESSFALLLRAKSGDEQAREALFSPAICPASAAGRMVACPRNSRSLLNTDDLAQEVLCRAFVSLEKFDPRHEGAFQGFLQPDHGQSRP